MRKAAYAVLILLFTAAGFYLGYYLFQGGILGFHFSTVAGYGLIALTALGGLVLGLLLSRPIIRGTALLTSRAVEYLQRMPVQDLLIGAIGLIIGLMIANLLSSILGFLGVFGKVLGGLLTVFLGYVGLIVSVRKRDELTGLFASLPWFGKEKQPRGEAKLLDTSAIIDGRIADLCNTGFLEGTLIVPAFVLEELQHIADSNDVLKRNRGRRGLDILNMIRRKSEIRVQIYESLKGLEEAPDVDAKLVRLGKKLGAKIITNDFNLNKVAELQGVKVLNVNELANALKPVVIPGEEMTVQVVKDGKEPGQGVAYLDDGTMIVVDSGKRFMGQTIRVVVTSVLQTTAGRMIFAKPKTVRREEYVNGEVNAVG